ncbi:hypothetical protein [Crateriforma conspicua]|uniref:hypothetical protein n=1 Tax=Crateriforma conspicua TaxID=2527996 RepID=UPI001187AC86|nr:hypothetical protein [Crateriforma conspicua]QDV62777.1 hypothetical protein Mal65_19130 [Crateriforma conspicua]
MKVQRFVVVEPRNFRVMLGGFLATLALVAGGTLALLQQRYDSTGRSFDAAEVTQQLAATPLGMQIVRRVETMRPDADGTASLQVVIGQAIEKLPPQADVLRYLGIATAVAVLGLVICGSGGPSIVGCILYPIPAILSLLGYCLRYGRGTVMVRLAHLIAGVGMLGYAYQLGWMPQDTPPYADPATPWSMVLAVYGLGTLGMAAIAGAVINMCLGGKRYDPDCLNVHTAAMMNAPNSQVSRQLQNVAVASGEDGLAGMKIDHVVRHYHDPSITISMDGNLSTKLAKFTSELESLDFESPLVIEVGGHEGLVNQVVQVGCQNMVLAVSFDRSGASDGSDALCVCLFGVLADGQVVCTVTKDAVAGITKRNANSGQIQIAGSRSAAGILKQHLETLVQRARRSGTEVAELYPGEWRDVYAYVHRVMLDIGHQHGDNGFKVTPSSHGRFQFPFQAVQPLSVASGSAPV